MKKEDLAEKTGVPSRPVLLDIDISSALDREKIEITPSDYIQFWVDGGPVSGIEIRLGSRAAAPVPLNKVDTFETNRESVMYVTCTALTRRTKLTLLMLDKPYWRSSQGEAGFEIANIFDTAYVTANDILPADLTPFNKLCKFRIQCQFSVAGVLTAMREVGGVPKDLNLNGGVNLIAGALYTFPIDVYEDDAYNFKYSINSNIDTFTVKEVGQGAGE